MTALNSAPSYTGRWITSFGLMELAQHGAGVRGAYHYRGEDCPVEGTIANGRLEFTYREPNVAGRGWFAMQPRGQGFSGAYCEDGKDTWLVWEGVRIGFDGLWSSTFGLLRLVVDGERVRGFYEVDGAANIEGTLTGNVLTFNYQEPHARGEGRFTLADDGLQFEGEWRPEGAAEWRTWDGSRIGPRNDRTWLVVLEAPWQRFLHEPEYAFGEMLRAFFARCEHVDVRHRFFTNEMALRRCCRDLFYLAEPVVLVVATHGRTEGIPVDGGMVPLTTLLDCLQGVGDLRLMHFSACLLMQDVAATELLRGFARETGATVSGYSTSVGWSASAIIEFTYLEMVLSKGVPPPEAANRVFELLAFSGDTAPSDSPFPAAGFRFVT